jgi:DNA-directed RNA polymerase specialized sigma subunit
MDSIEKSMQLHIIKENLHGLDQIDKQIILIKYFGDGSVSQKDIAKAC